MEQYENKEIEILIKDMLNFSPDMSDEQKYDLITSASAFARTIVGISSDKKIDTYTIGKPISKKSIVEGVAKSNGFIVNERSFTEKKDYLRNLTTVFHETSHFINQDSAKSFGVIINPELADYLSDLFKSYFDKSKVDEYESLSHKETRGIELSPSEKERCDFLKTKVGFMDEFIFSAYYNSPTEVRARAWGKAVRERMIEHAEKMQAEGKLTQAEIKNLEELKSQVAEINKEEEQLQAKCMPLNKENMEKLNVAVDIGLNEGIKSLSNIVSDSSLKSNDMEKNNDIYNICLGMLSGLSLRFDRKIAYDYSKILIDNLKFPECKNALIELFVQTDIRLRSSEKEIVNNILKESAKKGTPVCYFEKEVTTLEQAEFLKEKYKENRQSALGQASVYNKEYTAESEHTIPNMPTRKIDVENMKVVDAEDEEDFEM